MTILMLDDEPVVMKVLRVVLKQYNLLEATSAEQAIQLFVSNGRTLDLLLTDLSLPTSSGIQLALLLRTELPGLPVILTSGYPVGCWSVRDANDLKNLGPNCVAILQKPFYPGVLMKTVCELIGAPPPEMVRTA